MKKNFNTFTWVLNIIISMTDEKHVKSIDSYLFYRFIYI